MSTRSKNDFIIVIRSAGERTTEACKQIILHELPEDDVVVIELTPFEEALRESYKIGIQSDKEWLITIDADVLPKNGFIREIQQLISNVSESLFACKPLIYDKILMKHRLAGFRIYRNRFLHEALNHIPGDGQQIRPEEFTVNKMESKGYKTRVFEYVAGLHDFEQFYRDIYRKAYFHATKHSDHVAELMKEWKRRSIDDTDYLVVIKGSVDGLLSQEVP